MHKITYKPQVADMDIVIRRGQIGTIESNVTNAFFGEWIVFKYDGPDGNETAQIRFPLEYAVEHRLIVPEDKFEDNEQEDNEIER